MKQKPTLVWNNWNREHIKKHSVTVEEAEEAYDKSEIVAEGKNNRIYVLSKVRNGRIIIVYLSFQKQTRPYVVSARDASKKERRIYEEKNRTNI